MVVDDRFDYDELRIYAIGLVEGIEITVIYTDLEDDKRRSFPHGGQNAMNDATTGKTSEPKRHTKAAML